MAIRAADTHFVINQLAEIARGHNPDAEHTPLPHGLSRAVSTKQIGMFGSSLGGGAVPAVVITLAMNGVAQGLTLGLSKGLTCSSCASYTPKVVTDAVTSKAFGVPSGLFLWLGVVLLITFLLSYTTFGRRVYSIGNNPQASFLAGINVRLITVVLYMLSGLFAALAGITLAAYGGQASLGMGDPYLFQSIAAVVIGGVSILGGRGHYLGTAAGSIW